jgi:hypothetical protein
MKTLTIIFLLALSTPAYAARLIHFNDWPIEEKLEFAAYAGLSLVDYQQTSWALRQKDSNGNYLYKEANPLLTVFTGSRPSNEEMIAAQLLSLAGYYYMIATDQNKKYRYLTMGIKAAVVIQNDSVGISIKKVF